MTEREGIGEPSDGNPPKSNDERSSATPTTTFKSSTAGQHSISVRNLDLSFDDVDVLEDVSLTVEPGEFVGFVGPNGAGKTTLLRAISGALEPDAGRVTIGGVDIHDASSKASSRLVSVVPQDTSLSFSFPVRDVVEMGRHPHRSRFSPPTSQDREAVERALERTRTEEFADRPIDEVSGGQRQRVTLARAIAQETPALLLDEPTGSLDINHQIETLELVRELVDSGRAVCAAIHDLDLAARYCDQLVMLADGGVRRTGAPETVLSAETLSEVFESNAAVTENPVTGTSTVTALPSSKRGNFGEDRNSNAEQGSNLDREGSRGSDLDGSRDSDPDGSRRKEGHKSSRPARVHVVGAGSTAVGVLARLHNADLETSPGNVESSLGSIQGAMGDVEAAMGDVEATLGPVPNGDIAAETARRLDVDRIEAPPFDSLSEAHLSEVEAAISESDAVVAVDITVSPGNQLVLEKLAAARSLVVVETEPFETRHFAGDEARELYERSRDRARVADPEDVLEAVSQVIAEDDESEESIETQESTSGPEDSAVGSSGSAADSSGSAVGSTDVTDSSKASSAKSSNPSS